MPPEDSSTHSTSSPSEPAPESPSPVVEVPVESPAETPPPEPTPSIPEPAPAPATEPVAIPDSTSSTSSGQESSSQAEVPPALVEVVQAPETDQPETPTGQMAGNEPIPAPAIQQTGILHSARELLNKARVSIQDRKRKKRDKIMLTFTTKNKITNDEVEKLLHVSDTTATRYLSALEKEGKIIQVGTKGRGILYIKTP